MTEYEENTIFNYTVAINDIVFRSKKQREGALPKFGQPDVKIIPFRPRPAIDKKHSEEERL